MKYKITTIAFLLGVSTLGCAQIAGGHTGQVTPKSNTSVSNVSKGNQSQVVNKTTTSNNQTTPKVASNTDQNTTKVASNNNQNSNINNEQFMAQVEQEIYKQVNEQRVKAGLSPLTYSSTMQKFARMKSKDMGDNHYFSHANKNGQLTSSIMKKDGVNFSAWGENIAYIGGISNPQELANMFMKNWMNSPGHRANILSPNFTQIGVGVYKAGNTVYATQEFYKA